MMHNSWLLLFMLLSSGCACGTDAAADNHVAPRDRPVVRDFGAELRAKMEANSRDRVREDQAFLRRHAEESERNDRAARQFRETLVAFGMERSPWIHNRPRSVALYHNHVVRIADVIERAVRPFRDDPLVSAELDGYLVAAIAWHESNWAESVASGQRRGGRGEVGLLQIMPTGVCARIRDDAGRQPNLLNRVHNVQAAIRCLRHIRDEMYGGEGDVWRWLASYASGKRWPVGREAVEGSPGHEEDGFRGLFEALVRLRDRPVG